VRRNVRKHFSYFISRKRNHNKEADKDLFLSTRGFVGRGGGSRVSGRARLGDAADESKRFVRI